MIDPISLGASFGLNRFWDLYRYLLQRKRHSSAALAKKMIENFVALEPGLLSAPELERLREQIASGYLLELFQQPGMDFIGVYEFLAEEVLDGSRLDRRDDLVEVLWASMAATMSPTEATEFAALIRVERGVDEVMALLNRLAALLDATEVGSAELSRVFAKQLEQARAHLPLLPVRVPPPGRRAPVDVLFPRYCLTPLVGRDQELDTLLRWLRRPVLCAFVSGGPGDGKSRLAVEVGRLAEADGWLVGLLEENADPGALLNLASVERPRLIIVDDAERRLDEIKTLLDKVSTVNTASALRLLLVSRDQPDVALRFLRWSEEGQAALCDVVHVDLSESPLSDIALMGIYESAKATSTDQSRPSRASELRSRSFRTPLDAVVGVLTDEPSTVEALRVLAHRELSNLVAAARRQDVHVSTPTLQLILCAATLIGSVDGKIVSEFAKAALSGRQAEADAVALVTWLRRRTDAGRTALQVEPLAVELLSEQIAADAAALSGIVGAATSFKEIASVCDVLGRVVKAHPELKVVVENAYGTSLVTFLVAVNGSNRLEEPMLQRAVITVAVLLYELDGLELGEPEEWPSGGPERSYLRALGFVRKYNMASTEDLDAWERIELLQQVAIETFNAGQFQSALAASSSLMNIATAAIESEDGWPDELTWPIASWMLLAGTVGSESWRALDRPLQGWALCMQIRSVLKMLPGMGADDGSLRLPRDAALDEVFSSYLLSYRNVLQHLELDELATHLAEEAISAVRSHDGVIHLANASLLVSMASDLGDHPERLRVLERAESLAREQMEDAPEVGAATLANVLTALASELDKSGDSDRASAVISNALEIGEQAWSGLTEASAERLASLYTSAGYVLRRDRSRAVPLFQKAVRMLSLLHGPSGARQAVETTVRAWSAIGVGEFSDSVIFDRDLLRLAVQSLLEGLAGGDGSLFQDFQLLTLLYAHTLVSGSRGRVGPDDVILLRALRDADFSRFGTRGEAHMVLVSSMVEAFYTGESPTDEQRFQNSAARIYLESIGDRVIPTVFQPGPGDAAFADVQHKPTRPAREQEWPDVGSS